MINSGSSYKTTTIVRDGPFDIPGGGGARIFPCNKLFFFLSLYTTSYFFKSKLQQVFYIKKNIKLNTEKCKQKQHIE